jgi:hypothetical protein
MVIIRIKENGENHFSEKINDESVKIMKKLKLCKVVKNEVNHKKEEIEIINLNKTNNYDNKYGTINYKLINDKYMFIGL